ncbi:DUF2017 family protein [Arachnia propionica]|uniref:DUF2017 family protein n=1 Tax=Arachnia propionica TaxID=1750 RepID=UPI00163A8EB2|nr:DUF2017 family protein [Arachnia propionica]
MTPSWVFHASEGRGRLLRILVQRYANDLGLLLPDVISDDPLEELAAEMEAGERAARTVTEQPDFQRFFPPVVADAAAADEFRRQAVAGQARNRIEAARVVLTDLGEGERRHVQVPFDHIDAWVQVLSALRVQWHVELTGSGDRLVEATPEQIDDSPDTAALLDWLALLIEDALQTKWRTHPLS